MKLVWIAYNEAVDEEVAEKLTSLGIASYTKWTGVLGAGRTSGPHLLSHVWPKGNYVLAAVVSDEVAATLMDALRDLRKKSGHEGVKAFLMKVEDQT
ncbi:MAG: hypothetical protein KGY99_04470 [Phycisphaerae bacterium]|nr:hypothetical protein [Phycisphaerae bacterium]